MDNQRLIIWGLFAVMAYLTWQTWMQDYGPKPERPAIAEEAATPSPLEPDGDIGELPDLEGTGSELPAVSAAPDESASIESPAAASGETITVITDVAAFTINTAGGAITRAEMYKYPVDKDQPDIKVLLLDGGNDTFGQVRSWLRAKDSATPGPGPDTLFEAPARSYELGDADSLVVPLVWTNEAGVRFERRYVFNRGNYEIELQQGVENLTDTAWRGDQVTQLMKRSFDQERSMFNVASYSFDGPMLFDGSKAEKIDRGDLLNDGPQNITATDGWYASIQHHFLNAIVPQSGETNIYQIRVDANMLLPSGAGCGDCLHYLYWSAYVARRSRISGRRLPS